MTALISVVLFFFVLLVIYPAAAAAVTFFGWLKKRRVPEKESGGTLLAQIEDTTDRLKNRWFIISIVLAFFVIAPFLVLVMILRT